MYVHRINILEVEIENKDQNAFDSICAYFVEKRRQLTAREQTGNIYRI